MRFLLTIFISISCFYNFAQQPEQSKEVGLGTIETFPVYSGCDSLRSQLELQKCMNEKIQDLIANNFRKDISDTLDLPDGRVRIYNKMMIDSLGNINVLKVKAPHPVLEEEAKRVLKLIPPMSKPATKDLKPVNIVYYVPIIFKVTNQAKKEN